MEFFILYLLMISGNIKGLLIGLSIFGAAISSITGLVVYTEGDDSPKWYKYVILGTVLCSVTACLIPSKQEIALIITGGTVYNVVTSDTAKQIGGKGIELLNKKLDDYLNEDAPATK